MLSTLKRRLDKLERGKAKALLMQAELDQFDTWARLEIAAGKLDADFNEVLAAIKGWSF